MKACAVLSLLLSVLLLFRVVSPARIVRFTSSIINVFSAFFGSPARSNSLCLKSYHPGLLRQYGGKPMAGNLY